MFTTNSDSILHYDVEAFGDAGFAIPNPGNDPVTLNATIADVVAMVGKQVLNMNSTADRDLHTPPDIGLLKDLHQLYLNAGHMLSVSVVENNEPVFDSDHNSPDVQHFLIFPTPYRDTRNPWIKRYTRWMLCLISDLMQNTQNRREFDITPKVRDTAKKYMDRMYYDMATMLFRKTKAEAKVPGFILQPADFDTWNWSDWYVDTERIETVVHSRFVFTEDQLLTLAQGIPAAALPPSRPFPGTGNPDAADLAGEGSDSNRGLASSWTSNATEAGENVNTWGDGA